MSFAAPLWLAGLLLLPLVRWLHRGGRHRLEVPVSRLSLWRAAAVVQPAAGERRPPDPAWRRRALLAALLLLALAQPQQQPARRPLTLWVDDSISMLARDDKGTRLALGLAQARALLAERPAADVELRALSDPWAAPTAFSETGLLALRAAAGRREPQPPPAALLGRGREHWLLTDGADAAAFAWPDGRAPERVIEAGGITRNVGIERLSARRNPADPRQIDLLLKISNGGSAAETRELLVSAGGAEPLRSTQRIEPGQAVFVNLSVPSTNRVSATLQPGDALAEDDTLALDLAPLRRRRVAVDAGCAAPLKAALAVHPGIEVMPTGAAGAEAALDCGRADASPNATAAATLPTLRVRSDQLPAPARGALLWPSSGPEWQGMPLERERLQVAGALTPRPGDRLLLVAGDVLLIVARAGPVPVIETALDFGAMAGQPGAETPLLVDLLFEQLFGSPLLDPIAINDRGAAASFVVPINKQVRRPAAAAASAAPADTLPQRDRVQPLLVLAALVLLWEIVALARQALRLGAWRRVMAE